MVKIINRKKYNTDTAEKVGGWSNGCSMSDFSYVDESLYRKRSGEFFLHGEGGPQSKYAKSLGQNSWGYGEDITPLSLAEAMEWAEKHLEAEEYEEIFGRVDDDGETESVHYVLPPAAAEKVRKAAQERNCDESRIILDLINAM